MQYLVKSTTGNGKKRYLTHTSHACMHVRVVSQEDKARRVIYWYYTQKNIKAKQNNSTLNLTEFCSLIHPGPFEAKYIL